MGDFQFITTIDDPKLVLRDAKSRQLIRRTATRATRSAKAVEASVQHQHQSDAVRSTSQRGGMTRFRTRQSNSVAAAKKDAVSERALSMSPLMVQIAVWDPVVEPLGGQAWTLLHYYRYLFRSRSWAINAKQDWFAFVIQDPVSTHATLAFVSLNRDLEEGSTVSSSTLHHRTKAMALIRQRLASSEACIDDALIGAVALLAITEGLEGHFALSVAHVQALARLVGLRGGFAKLHYNEALSRLVAWADICHTASSSGHRHLPGLFSPEDLTIPSELSPRRSSEAYFFQRLVKAILTPVSFQLVKLLAAVPRYPPDDTTSISERQNISRLIYCMNQILLSSVRNHDSTIMSQPAALLTKVLHDATYLYISLVLRQMPRRTTVVVQRRKALQAVLQSMEECSSSNLLPSELLFLIMFWAFTVYFCSLLPEDHDQVLQGKIRKFVKRYKIKDINSFEDRLSYISWVNGFGHGELGSLMSD